MMQWTQFYRLIGIDEAITEPTHYQLLGVDPRHCTAQAIERALTERKKNLRQNIPGPQFIPLVLTFEREQLDAAANVLGDLQRRRQYDRELAKRQQTITNPQLESIRREIVRQARHLIAEAVNPDGTLGSEQRFSLAQQLSRLGINTDEVKALLERIPVPAPHQKTRRATRPDSSEIVFFTKAVDFTIANGALLDNDERQLYKLARHLGISAPITESIINRQLVEKGVTKYQPQTAPALQDTRLIGAKISVDQFQFYQQKQPFWNLKTIVIASLLALMAVAFFGVLTLIGMREKQTPHTQQFISPPPLPGLGKEVTKTSPPAVPVTSPDQKTNRLLEDLLSQSADRAALKKILDPSEPDELKQAFTLAAKSMQNDSDRHRADSAIELFHTLLLGHYPAPYQQAAADALFNACTEAFAPADSKQPAMILAEVILINPSAGIVLIQSDQHFFLNQCQTLWRNSVQNYPQDPAFDPHRLAEMLCTQGQPALYFAIADKDHFLQVVRRIAAWSADRQSPLSDRATQRLMEWGSPTEALPDYVINATHLAMCDVLQNTDDPQRAEKIFLVLAKSVNIHDIPELVSSDFTSPDFRRRAATILKAYFETGSIPDQYRARQFPPFTSAHVTNDAGKDFRSFYSDTDRVRDVLADIAITLLACCERAEKLTAGQDQAAAQLNQILNHSPMVSEIIRKITVTYDPTEAADFESEDDDQIRDYSNSATLSDDQFKTTRQSLTGDDLTRRYQTMNQLADMNSRQSAELLLDLLNEPKIIDHRPSFYRVLRCLRTMDAPQILTALIDRIDQSEPFVSHAIVRTLILETQITPDPQGILPLEHDQQQCRDCAAWWKQRANQGGLNWNTNTAFPPITRRLPRTFRTLSAPGNTASKNKTPAVATTQNTEPAPSGSPASWRPDLTTLQLMAAIADYAKRLADQLIAFQWDNLQSQSSSGPSANLPVTVNAVEIGPDLFASLAAVNDQLARLIRSHPRGRSVALETDVILIRQTAKELACDTDWQQMAVRLESQGLLLEVLLRLQLNDDAEQLHRLEQLAHHRSGMIKASPNVFYEIREYAYYNLVYWDMLNPISPNNSHPDNQP